MSGRCSLWVEMETAEVEPHVESGGVNCETSGVHRVPFFTMESGGVLFLEYTIIKLQANQ